jgi:hypothetical protein
MDGCSRTEVGMSILNALNFKCELINIYVENIKKACGNASGIVGDCLYFISETEFYTGVVWFLGDKIRLRVHMFSQEHLDMDIGETPVTNLEKGFTQFDDVGHESNLKLKHFVTESPFSSAVFCSVFGKNIRTVSKDSVVINRKNTKINIYLDRVELSVYGQLIKVIELKENKKEMLKDLKEIWK